MLQDKYNISLTHIEWTHLNFRIKGLAGLTTVNGRNVESQRRLLVLSVLFQFNLRLSAALIRYKAKHRLMISQSEAIAFYLAYKEGLLPNEYETMTIVERIDRTL